MTAKKTVLVVAPHPDDETLGCGGALLRHRAEGDDVHWLIVTSLTQEAGYDEARRATRAQEIGDAARHYGFAQVHALGFPTTQLDALARADLVKSVGAVVRAVAPDTIYTPFAGDAHSDHAVVAETVGACAKWFRYPSVRRVRAYETLSETGFGLGAAPFAPNLFIDISPHLEGKIAAMRLYRGEMGLHPFPRSEEGLRALAILRGGMAGCGAAEAFISLREIL